MSLEQLTFNQHDMPVMLPVSVHSWLPVLLRCLLPFQQLHILGIDSGEWVHGSLGNIINESGLRGPPPATSSHFGIAWVVSRRVESGPDIA